MKEGITERRIRWKSPKGNIVSIRFSRMTSFVRLSLFLIKVDITLENCNLDIKIISKHNGEVHNFYNAKDPRVAGESKQYLSTKNVIVEDNVSYILAETSCSGLKVCSSVMGKTSKQASYKKMVYKNMVEHEFVCHLSQNEELTYLQYSVFGDSVRNCDVESYVRNENDRIICVPVEQLFEEQKNYMESYWKKSELVINGDRDLSLATHYNQYALLQSAGKDSFSSVASKGLSGEGYEGHYFWDTEMFVIPYFVITSSEIVKNLLSYRYHTLDKARENARLMSHKKGVLFPWRTISGEECSGHYPSGTAAYHVNGAICYAIISYYLATGDFAFMTTEGAEIILESARLWLELGNYHEDRFEVHEVTGPDEYTCMVSNNYYTNAIAKYNLEWAGKLVTLFKERGCYQPLADKIRLTQEEVMDFERAAQKMYLPYNEKLKINPQDDSFLSKKRWDLENTKDCEFPLLLHYHPLTLYRYQVCKQADTVLSHFILEDYQDIETIRNSFCYYEHITTHDSSLSQCIFSIMASKLKMKEKAYEYFGDSAKLDLFNLHQNTKDGIHVANMAGNYMAIVYGFAGLRIKESGIWFEPTIPEAWNSYSFHLVYHGIDIDVYIDKCKCILKTNDELLVHVNGKSYEVKETLEIIL